MKAIKIIPAEEALVAPRQHPPIIGRRILVVDDERDSRELTMAVLADAGFEVQAAKDGAAGWEAIQAESFDLVITDNRMPRMTGLEMIEKVRAARLALPVMMSTGYMPTHEFARRPWLTPDVALQKPYTNDELLKAVAGVLGSGGDNGGSQRTLLPQGP